MSISNKPSGDLALPRERHIGRLLLRAHRAFSARAAEKLRQRGYDDVALAHIALLPHLDEAGTRATTLAALAGMTKQGMGQLVRELEMHGYLERRPDPTDGRAALVCFTATGRRLLEDAIDVTRELDEEYAALLGTQRFNAFREALLQLAEHGRDEWSPKA
jgi:DNA-binding MarR family transcriptional regulator